MTRTATAPAARRTVLTTALCGCGCGIPVKSANSVYAPGHDARHAGLVASALAVTTGQDLRATLLGALPSAALQAKAIAAAERLVARNAKAAKPRVRLSDSAKRAEARQAPFAPADDVKVGRWTYPARVVDGNLVRNTKRDGSGEWVAA